MTATTIGRHTTCTLTRFNMSFPLKVTEAAIKRFIDVKDSDRLGEDFFIRASVKGGGCSGFQNELAFDDKLDPEEDIFEVFSYGGKQIKIATDAFSAMYMQDVTLDFVTESMQEGFKFSGGSSERKQCACGSSFSQ